MTGAAARTGDVRVGAGAWLVRSRSLRRGKEIQVKLKLNRRLFARVIAAIKRKPESFDMEFYGERSECATTCCLAGHAALLARAARFTSDGILVPRRASDDGVGCAAARVLGLDEDAEARLFHVPGWPAKFAARYNNAETPRARVAATVARVRHFLASGR